MALNWVRCFRDESDEHHNFSWASLCISHHLLMIQTEYKRLFKPITHDSVTLKRLARCNGLQQGLQPVLALGRSSCWLGASIDLWPFDVCYAGIKCRLSSLCKKKTARCWQRSVFFAIIICTNNILFKTLIQVARIRKSKGKMAARIQRQRPKICKLQLMYKVTDVTLENIYTADESPHFRILLAVNLISYESTDLQGYWSIIYRKTCLFIHTQSMPQLEDPHRLINKQVEN
jgi:hypothetical protein